MNLMNTLYVTLIQSFLAFFITLMNAILQISAYIQLGGSPTDVLPLSSPVALRQISTAKQMLLASFFSQIIAFVLLGIVIFFILKNRDQFKQQMTLLVSLSLFIGAFLMFIGGIVGAVAASYLQCYRTDKNVDSAWRLSTITALTGLLGSVLTLLVQGFLRRDKSKGRSAPEKRVQFEERKREPTDLEKLEKEAQEDRFRRRGRQSERPKEIYQRSSRGRRPRQSERRTGGSEYYGAVTGSMEGAKKANLPMYNPKMEKEKYSGIY